MLNQLAGVKHRQRQALWIPVWFCLLSFCTPSIVYDCTTVQSKFLWHIINVERQHPLTVPTQTMRYRNNWTLFAKRQALLIETGCIYQDLFTWFLMICEALECGKPLLGPSMQHSQTHARWCATFKNKPWIKVSSPFLQRPNLQSAFLFQVSLELHCASHTDSMETVLLPFLFLW